MSNVTSTVAYWRDLNVQFTFYFTVISSVIGIPSNIVSAWIFIQIMKKNKTTMGFLYLIQSLVDLVFLILLLFVLRTTPVLFSRSFYADSDFACRMLSFSRRFMPHCSCVVTIVTTIDRFLAVCYPNRSKFMQKKSALLALIIGLMIFMFIMDIPNFFFYLSGTICTAEVNLNIVADLMGISFRTYLPSLAMIIMDTLIIRRMRISSRVVRQTAENRKENQFTRAVIAFDVFFLICSLPIGIVLIIYDVYLYTGAFRTDPVLFITYVFWFNRTQSFSNSKAVLTFFMNLIFNKIFWNEVRGKFRKENSVSYSNSSSQRNVSVKTG